MTTTVKYHDSTHAGAPTLTGQAGSLIALLDACLVDGFNVKALTGITVSSGVATATCATVHGNPLQSVVLISGATPAGLNGEKRVTWADSNTFKFDATGIADGDATGTISCKRAPAGWEKVFSGTNKAVYRALSGNRHYLRVDNGTTIAANKALVFGCENMTDVDTYDVRFPTAAKLAQPMWKTSSTADSTARAWRLIADDRMFYLAVRWTTSYWHDIYCFGEIAPSFKVGDSYHTVIGAISTDDGYPRSAQQVCASFYGSGLWVARAQTQLPGAVQCRYVAGNPASGWSLRPSATDYPTGVVFAFPNASDNGLLLSPAWVEEYPPSVRGKWPGMLCCMQRSPMVDGDILDVVEGLDGRRVLLQAWGGYMAMDSSFSYETVYGRVAFDLTGPWR